MGSDLMGRGMTAATLQYGTYLLHRLRYSVVTLQEKVPRGRPAARERTREGEVAVSQSKVTSYKLT